MTNSKLNLHSFPLMVLLLLSMKLLKNTNVSILKYIHFVILVVMDR